MTEEILYKKFFVFPDESIVQLLWINEDGIQNVVLNTILGDKEQAYGLVTHLDKHYSLKLVEAEEEEYNKRIEDVLLFMDALKYGGDYIDADDLVYMNGLWVKK